MTGCDEVSQKCHKNDLEGEATVIGTGGDISIFKDDLNFFDDRVVSYLHPTFDVRREH